MGWHVSIQVNVRDDPVDVLVHVTWTLVRRCHSRSPYFILQKISNCDFRQSLNKRLERSDRILSSNNTFVVFKITDSKIFTIMNSRSVQTNRFPAIPKWSKDFWLRPLQYMYCTLTFKLGPSKWTYLITRKFSS